MGGWNRPSGAAKPPVRKPSLRLVLIAGAAVFLAALGVAYLFVAETPSQAARPVRERAKGRLIREVEPAAAPKAEAPAPEPEKPKKPHYWELPTTNGLTAAQIRKWKAVRVPPPSYTNNAMLLRAKSRFEIFGTRAENEIAMLLTLEPGEGLVGSPNYGAAFREEFLRSCETPIVITAEDDEYQKRLKKDMIQTKIELRQRMADGEDICQIMAATREEAMRLGRIKQQIEGQARALFGEARTEEDLDCCLEAANALLAKDGIAPIELSPMLRRNLLRRMQER